MITKAVGKGATIDAGGRNLNSLELLLAEQYKAEGGSKTRYITKATENVVARAVAEGWSKRALAQVKSEIKRIATKVWS
jgi:hypothetical protein